jgi:CheY-like chemotaxis protein/anti-sigma regulatory factor (Ser/Thr protein kinase)
MNASKSLTDNPVEPANTPFSTPTHTVLIVDDSVMDRHLAGAIVQKMTGWQPAFACHGKEALDLLSQKMPDVVLTDMLMPEMDGLELVQAIRAKYPLLPVILMTAHGSEDIAIRALQNGAASYVPKKSLARDLADTLEQVLSASQINRHQRRVLASMTHHETHFLLENDTALVAPLVGHLEQTLQKAEICPESGLVLVGVALHEALTNAILHGNLELKSEMRETNEKEYYRLATERRTQSPFSDRRVFVSATLTQQEATFVIRDEGEGFNPDILPDPTDPANLGKPSGRGLLLIQTFMDHVEHNEKGNQIILVKRRSGG